MNGATYPVARARRFPAEAFRRIGLVPDCDDLADAAADRQGALRSSCRDGESGYLRRGAGVVGGHKPVYDTRLLAEETMKPLA